ncbi:ABC-2 transporter permease [Paenibacillus aceti]|uniref:ABC-2 transporter permease n=1 Tax=Paenibacillus aceti TaxID=1820010 RepID=UPI000EA2EA4F|nr:ABC-2 transporter permease [Paenibacillus aceti]
MLFHLIKKDFLIVKKYAFLMLLVSILIPLFVLTVTPELPGSVSFFISEIFSIFMLLQFVSMKEYQYPKATSLLCATPYRRSTIVASKYGFCMFIFLVCCLTYLIDSFFFPDLGRFSLEMISITFLSISLVIGIYLPIQYKLGYEKTRFFFIIIIMVTPFLLPQIIQFNDGIDMTSLVPSVMFSLIALFSSLIFLLLSIYISVKIYNHKDLV